MKLITYKPKTHVLKSVANVWLGNKPDKIDIAIEVDGEKKIVQAVSCEGDEGDIIDGLYYHITFEENGKQEEDFIHCKYVFLSNLWIKLNEFMKKYPETITVYNNLYDENNILKLCDNGTEYRAKKSQYDTYSMVNAFLCNEWYKLNKLESKNK